jgi:hypothetical protein
LSFFAPQSVLLTAFLAMSVGTAAASVTISQPTANATVTSPARVVASASPDSSSARISAMVIQVNYEQVYKTYSSSLDTKVSVKTGLNLIKVKAWDTSGKMYVAERYVYGGDVASTDSVTTYSNIDQMSGWGSCDECAGKDGDGASAVYSMKQGVSSPSLDGKSTKFFLGGSEPYANALWWKKLIGDATVVRKQRHFKLDMYFYYTNASAVQGLEFAITQYTDGKKYNFGMQCNVRNGGQWDVSSGNLSYVWTRTDIPCPAPPTYKWNHLEMEFERTSDGKQRYISVTLNGKKSYVNKTFGPRTTSSNQITFHYQMNGNKYQTDYSTWTDKITVKTW